MIDSVANNEEWDASCADCSHTMMDGEWETDHGPDGLDDVRFCPECGRQSVELAQPRGSLTASQ